jgi:Fe-S oxidoreductase
MVPSWKMITGKRVRLQRKGPSGGGQQGHRLHRWLDRLRPRYPLKFDFCRMTMEELTSFVDQAIREDKKEPDSYKPLVAIGHTKDLVDFRTIAAFLDYLKRQGIKVVNLRDTLARCQPDQLAAAPLN